MKKYRKNLILALVCFLIVIVLNFFLPRLLPGNPIAYLTGFSEEDMTPAQAAYYRQALHLDEPVFAQFGHYLRSLFDGTLGYSYKKETTVSALIGQRLGYTLQITLPAVVLSTALGLLWGLHCGYKKGSVLDKLSTTFQSDASPDLSCAYSDHCRRPVPLSADAQYRQSGDRGEVCALSNGTKGHCI